MYLKFLVSILCFYNFTICSAENELSNAKYLIFSGGLNTSTIYQKPSPLTSYDEQSYNYNAGISIPIINSKNHLLFNIGYILRKNKLYEYENSFTKQKIENIENNHYLIFNSNYKFDIPIYRKHSIYIKGGAFLAYLINTENLLPKNHQYGNDPVYINFDAGLNIGAGYEYKFSFYEFGIEYCFQQGFINKLDEYERYWNQSHLINLVFGVSLD